MVYIRHNIALGQDIKNALLIFDNTINNKGQLELVSNNSSEINQTHLELSRHYHLDAIDCLDLVTTKTENLYKYIFIDISFFDLGSSNSSLLNRQSVFSSLWAVYPEALIIVLASEDQNKKIICVVRAGADDYLLLPVTKPELELFDKKLDDSTMREARLRYLDGRFWDLKYLKKIKTSSSCMREVYQKIRTIADKNVSVLLTGETGVGKNVVAKLIHQHSSRKNKPFIAVHCGAITESLVESELFGHEKGSFTGAIKRKLGKFELAHGGTLFLDEIGTVSPSTQIKLLQVLQDSFFQRVGGEEDIKVDIRIIAATNENLKLLTETGKFRKDLFFRLNVFSIHIPSLNERLEDIQWLTEQFVKKYSRLHRKEFHSIRPEVFEALSKYNWPGNIRELENLTERACLLETTDRVRLQSFPLEVTIMAAEKIGEALKEPHSLAYKRTQVIEDFEKKYLEDLLLRHNGKIREVAETAQLGERQIHKLLSKYEIIGKEYRTKEAELNSPNPHNI